MRDPQVVNKKSDLLRNLKGFNALGEEAVALHLYQVHLVYVQTLGSQRAIE